MMDDVVLLEVIHQTPAGNDINAIAAFLHFKIPVLF